MSKPHIKRMQAQPNGRWFWAVYVTRASPRPVAMSLHPTTLAHAWWPNGPIGRLRSDR